MKTEKYEISRIETNIWTQTQKIVETELKESTYLENTEGRYTGWMSDSIQLQKGEKVNVWIQHYNDGRTYYTAFKKQDGIYYTRTHMKDQRGKIHKNCGGHTASKELKKMLEPK